MKQFKPSLIKVALISSGFAFGLSPALAQEAADANAADDTEVIMVSGIRGSLMRAQALKMDNTSIVEVLSAEDIGKLPDTSVAESLARLPGLAGERRNGRTSGLSVRGFNENYIGTSLNGRELLGMGDNRGVEFDLYPTEIVANVLVYKTPEAGLLTQGIGGTIDLQTVKPLYADSTLTFNANYEQNEESAFNSDFDDNGHRLSLNYVEQFADDKIGLALAIASLETPRQEEQFRGWGYTGANPANAAPGVTVPDGTQILAGHDSFVRSALLERNSIAAVVQYAPSDKLMIQLDALYIDFEENDIKRGIEEGGPEWGGVNYTITEVENGLVTAGYHDGFASVVRNDAKRQESDLTTFGLNIEYQINDSWTAVADFSTGEVEKEIIDIESYSGVGRAGTTSIITPRSWTQSDSGAVYGSHPTLSGVDLTDASLVRLAGTNFWGHPLVGSDAQDGFVNQPIFEEDLDSVRLSIEGDVEWSIFNNVEVGLNYADRTKSKVNNGAYLTHQAYPGDAAIPDPVLVNLDFIGINGILGYDSLGLFESGAFTATDASRVQADRLGDTYTVSEEITTLYAKLNIDTEIGDINVKGNLGLQVIDVDQSSTGFSTIEQLQTGAEFPTIVATPVSGGDKYTDVLPTLNLSFEIADNQYIRTGLSKVISRPRMDDMRPNTQATFSFNDNNILSTDPENGPWGGSAGNPTLKPLEANQFDLSYENYFADDGFFAVAFLYKDIKNWHRDRSTLTDFSDIYIPGFHQTSDGLPPAQFQGGVTSVLDGFEGFVRGWEFQASVPFHLISESLDGFGIVANATFLDGKLEELNDVPSGPIPGLSEESYSLTAYYEYKGFEIRVSGTKRDSFLTEERGLSLSLVDATDQGGEIWDAQIGYDFSESGIEALYGLRVTLQAQNLGDEPTIQNNGSGDPRQITKYQRFGANYLLGVNYSFW